VQPAFFGLTDLFRVPLAIRDLRTRGRLDPVTLWGVLSIFPAASAPPCDGDVATG
jgi:hypothetical protein